MASTDHNKSEELVAYLDGELGEAAASEIDDALAGNASAREDVEKLSRTWDLLDLLPEAKASSDFTKETLTVIQTRQPKTAPEAETILLPAPADSGPRRMAARWLIRAGGFVALTLAAAAGFNSSFRKGADPIDELLRELPLIQRLDQYREAGDIEFLQQLQESGLVHADDTDDI